MGSGRCAMGDGLWAMGYGRWAMGYGLWAMRDGLRAMGSLLIADRPSRLLNGFAVEMLHGNLVEVDALEAANVDRRHLVALGIGAVGERVDAAVLAEAVL